MVVTKKMIEALRRVGTFVERQRKRKQKQEEKKIIARGAYLNKRAEWYRRRGLTPGEPIPLIMDRRPGSGVGRKRRLAAAKKRAEQEQRRAEMQAEGLL